MIIPLRATSLHLDLGDGAKVGGKGKRTAITTVATMLFAVFGLVAITVGVFDMMYPVYPWGHRLPIFGETALLVGVLSLVATSLLGKSKRMGGYLGIVSFAIAYAVNVYVGEHKVLHAIVGVMAGLVLFIPLAFGWKNLES